MKNLLQSLILQRCCLDRAVGMVLTLIMFERTFNQPSIHSRTKILAAVPIQNATFPLQNAFSFHYLYQIITCCAPLHVYTYLNLCFCAAAWQSQMLRLQHHVYEKCSLWFLQINNKGGYFQGLPKEKIKEYHHHQLCFFY